MKYDVIILGGGPAGYTSAIYCARAGLEAAVVESRFPGGQMATTPLIENYPGFIEVDGLELALKMKEASDKLGAVSLTSKPLSVSLDAKSVTLENGSVLSADALIIATGADPRELGLTNETELRGKGVSYCATCDGMLYRRKKVAVVGGGNTAVSDALYLANLCEEVYLVHRRDSLRASAAEVAALKSKPNVILTLGSVVDKIYADGRVDGIEIRDVITAKSRRLDVDGVFIAVGRVPNTGLFKGQLTLDGEGYVVAGEDTRTSVDGVFAAGDVRAKPLRQIVTATADGAVAATFAERFIASRNTNK